MNRLLKYFVTLFMVSAVLTFGIATVSVYPFKVSQESNKVNDEDSAPGPVSGFFSKSEISSLFGLGNERTNISEPGQTIPGAAANSASNSLRINHLQQIHHQLYNTGNNFYLLQSAFKQLNGYYLYHLCKLLI